MNLRENIKEAVITLKTHNLRSILTMLGVIIGVTSITGLLSISLSNQKKVLEEIEIIGSDIMWINSSSNTLYSQKCLLNDDIKAIKKQCSAVVGMAKELKDSQRVTYSNKHLLVNIVGVEPDYQLLRSLILTEGRFITSFDLGNSRRVCVIEDSKEIKKLFGLSNPFGKDVLITGLRFKVIGRVSRKNVGIGMNYSPMVYLPLTTLQRINKTKRIDLVYAKVPNYNLVKKGKQQIELVLSQRYGYNHGFEIECASEMIETTKEVMNVITIVGIGIATISLIVGGIGIANVMLVSVTERKREIGIRRAIGAKKQDILTQFLIEALTLSLIGGVIGIILGAGIGITFNLLLNLPLSFHWWIALIGFLFSVAVGIFSGLYPAIQAANLDPIQDMK